MEPGPFRQLGSFAVRLELIFLAVSACDESFDTFCCPAEDEVLGADEFLNSKGGSKSL